MTVAALEALALREVLASETPHLAQRFFRRIAPLVDQVWTAGVANDLQAASLSGRRPLKVHAMNAWMDQFFAAAQHDEQLSVMFARVASLVDPPSRFLSWTVARRVLAHRFSAGGADRAARIDRAKNTRIGDSLLRSRP